MKALSQLKEAFSFRLPHFSIIKTLLAFTDPKERRTFATAVCVNGRDIVATNGTIMAVIKQKENTGVKCIIDACSLRDMLKVMYKKKNVENDGVVSFDTGVSSLSFIGESKKPIKIKGVLLDNSYPDYHKVIPTETPAYEISVDIHKGKDDPHEPVKVKKKKNSSKRRR